MTFTALLGMVVAMASASAAPAPPSGPLPSASIMALTSKDIAALMATISPQGPSTRNIVEARAYSLAVGHLADRNGLPEVHRRAARIFLILRGSATLRLGGRILTYDDHRPADFIATNERDYSAYRELRLARGMVVNLPAGTPYQLVAAGSDIRFIVVRIAPND